MSREEENAMSPPALTVCACRQQAPYWIPVAFMMTRSTQLKVYKSKSHCTHAHCLRHGLAEQGCVTPRIVQKAKYCSEKMGMETRKNKRNLKNLFSNIAERFKRSQIKMKSRRAGLVLPPWLFGLHPKGSFRSKEVKKKKRGSLLMRGQWS